MTFYDQEIQRVPRKEKGPRSAMPDGGPLIAVHNKLRRQPLDRMRTMKESKPSSATCHHRYSSPRKATMLS